MATLQEQAQTFNPDDLRDMALQVAEHYELPRDMFLGLMAHESSWNPNAKNPKSSALGLGQFIDGTAKGYFQGLGEIDGGPDDPRRHPGYSMDASARYLKDLYKQHGDWQTALKRYGENTDAYLNLVKEAARREGDEHQHFRQGQFLEAVAPLDVGFGLQPTEFQGQPGELLHKVKDYLGLNNQPWQPGRALRAAVMAAMKESRPQGEGPDLEEQQTLEMIRQITSGADLGMSPERLLYDLPSYRGQVETETQRVLGRFVDGFTASLTEGAKKAAFGDTFQPETVAGKAAGQAAYLGGQILGPFKFLSWLTGSYLMPSVAGLRTVAQVVETGMSGGKLAPAWKMLGAQGVEGALNLGLLQGLSRVVPGLIESDTGSQWAAGILHDAQGGALVGVTFPLLSLAGGGTTGRLLRMGTGFAAMDYLRAAPGQWSTLGDFVKAVRTWDDDSKKQFANLAYQYALDLYFANRVRPYKEQLAAYGQRQIFREMISLNPEEAEREILQATGQREEEEGLGGRGQGLEKRKTTLTTPAAVRVANPEAAESIEIPTLAEAREGQAADLAEQRGFKLSGEWQLLQDELVYPPGGEYRTDFATGKRYGRWTEKAVDSEQWSVDRVKETETGKARRAPAYDLEKALARYDRATMIRIYGGFDPQAEIIKRNFEPEEQKIIRLFSRKEAQGPDALLSELKGAYPDMFGEFETDADFLMALAQGRLKAVDYDKLEEYHNESIARQAVQEGTDPEGLAEIEADVKREALAERDAIQNEPRAGADLNLKWTGAEPELGLRGGAAQPSRLKARLDALQADYPDLDRERAATVLRALPEAEDGQVAAMSADPEMFSQVARGNLSAAETQQLLKKAGDASRQMRLEPEGRLLYGGGPDTAGVLRELRDNVAGAGERWREIKDHIKETLAPAGVKAEGVKDVSQALITMMGRKREAVEQAAAALWDFHKVFKTLPEKEWVRVASTWQQGKQTGTDLDRGWEIFHEINEALVPQIVQIKDLPYRENYLRQAWRNAKNPEFKENINNFLGGRAFKNYLDLDEQGRPTIWRAVFDDKGGYALEQVWGGVEGAAEEAAAGAAGDGGKTLTGGRGYFKPKTLPDWQTGIMLGGKSRFKNLWDLMLFDIGEKNQFIWGNKFIGWAWNRGYVQELLREKMPVDWQEIQDPTQRISYANLREVMEGRSFEEMPGDYEMSAEPKYRLGVANYVLAAPGDVARIINNWLSPGLRGNPVYELYRDIADPLRALGVIGPFHLRFIMNASMAMGTGRALSRAMGELVSGDMEALGTTLKEGALNQVGVQFIRQLAEGKRGLEAALKGTKDPILAEGVRDYLDTGGNISAAAGQPLARRVGESLWEGLVQLGKVHPFQALHSTIEGLMAPVATGVQFAKFGGFLILRRALLEKLDAKYQGMAGDAGELAAAREQEFRNGLYEMNKHLDNIYGQMNYDALLINRTVKDLLFFVIKYPGWNLGSGRWLGAMVSGAKHGLLGQEVSQYERESLRTGLGIVVNQGIYSALLYWFINGKPPDNIGELYMKGVWTGGYTRGGNQEFLSDASYWKDLRGIIPVDQNLNFAPGRPLETLKAKAADIWRIPQEVFSNREAWSHYQIATPGAPSQWPGEYGKYILKQVSPYMLRNILQGESAWGKYGSLVGLTRTAARLTDTPALQAMREIKEARTPQVVTTVQQGNRQVRKDVMDLAYKGDGPGFIEALEGARARGEIDSRKFKEVLRSGEEILRDPHYGPLRLGFRRLELGEAIRIYGLATAEEREALHLEMLGKWGRAQPEQRRKYREDFQELENKIGAGGQP